MQRAARDCEVIFHLAAIVSVAECQGAPRRCHETNILGTEIVTQAAIDNMATLVFASSCAVYGSGAAIPCRESATPAPANRYASSKLEGERAILAATASDRLAATPVRLFNVFGRGQRADVAYAAVVSSFAEAIRTGNPATVEGDGLQTRDFVPVSLAVEAMCRAACSPACEPVNIGTGRETSLLQLIDLLEAASGQELARHHVPARVDDILRSVADTQRLQEHYDLPGDLGSEAAVRHALQELLSDPGTTNPD